MKKYCVVIDNEDQKRVFDSLVKAPMRKSESIDVEGIIINVSDPDLKNDSNNIDINKLRERLALSIKNKSISAFATDFNMDDDNVNGKDIVELIYEQRPQTPIVVYSGKLNDLVKSFMGDYKQLEERDLISKIKKLRKFKIHNFVERENYSSCIIEVLKNKINSAESQLIQCLRDNSDMQFKSCYPYFKGKNLGEIANEIEEHTPLGLDFQNALLEQTIAYLININSDSE